MLPPRSIVLLDATQASTEIAKSQVSLSELLVERAQATDFVLTVVVVPPIPPKPKPSKRCNRKLKDSKFVKMDQSLIAEAVAMFSASPVAPLGLGLSSLLAESIAQSPQVSSHVSTTVSGAIQKSSPIRDFFPAGFPQIEVLYCDLDFAGRSVFASS